jgi:hypothetical protein
MCLSRISFKAYLLIKNGKLNDDDPQASLICTLGRDAIWVHIRRFYIEEAGL